MALSNQPVFKDQRTRKKIDLHLRDINDKITEIDIANVQTDVTTNLYDNDPEAEKEVTDMLKHKQEEDKNNREDGNNSNRVESSWDVLK